MKNHFFKDAVLPVVLQALSICFFTLGTAFCILLAIACGLISLYMSLVQYAENPCMETGFLLVLSTVAVFPIPAPLAYIIFVILIVYAVLYWIDNRKSVS